MKKKKLKNNLSHREACIVHARRKGRWIGIEFAKEDNDNVVKLIQQGASTCIYQETNARTHHRLRYKDDVFIAIYDKKLKVVVTVYTDALYREKWQDNNSRSMPELA